MSASVGIRTPATFRLGAGLAVALGLALLTVACSSSGSSSSSALPVIDVAPLVEGAPGAACSRVASQIQAAGNDGDAIRKACQSIEGFDPKSEDKLQLLSAILRGSSSTQIDVLKQRLGVERECTVENLKDLRNHLFPEC